MTHHRGAHWPSLCKGRDRAGSREQQGPISVVRGRPEACRLPGERPPVRPQTPRSFARARHGRCSLLQDRVREAADPLLPLLPLLSLLSHPTLDLSQGKAPGKVPGRLGAKGRRHRCPSALGAAAVSGRPGSPGPDLRDRGAGAALGCCVCGRGFCGGKKTKKEQEPVRQARPRAGECRRPQPALPPHPLIEVKSARSVGARGGRSRRAGWGRRSRLLPGCRLGRGAKVGFGADYPYEVEQRPHLRRGSVGFATPPSTDQNQTDSSAMMPRRELEALPSTTRG
jgi:hypothetical protein